MSYFPVGLTTIHQRLKKKKSQLCISRVCPKSFLYAWEVNEATIASKKPQEDEPPKTTSRAVHTRHSIGVVSVNDHLKAEIRREK